MDFTIEKILSKSNTKIYFIDIISLAVIYFLPTLSHMFSIPLYFIEPMRLALVASIIYTNRTNSFVIALTLPIFSYIISSHPVFVKTLLITTELLFNAVLFYSFIKLFRNTTLAFAISIVLAKIYYYTVKLTLLKFALLQGGLISTPILVQIIMILLLTAGFYFYQKKNKQF